MTTVLPSGSAVAFLQLPEQLVIHECAAWLLHEDEKRVRIRLNETSGMKQTAKTRLQLFATIAGQEVAKMIAFLQNVERQETKMREVGTLLSYIISMHLLSYAAWLAKTVHV